MKFAIQLNILHRLRLSGKKHIKLQCSTWNVSQSSIVFLFGFLFFAERKMKYFLATSLVILAIWINNTNGVRI